MKKKLTIIFSVLLILAVAGVITVLSSAYTVKMNQQLLVTRLSRIQYVEAQTGLHFHTPFIEDTVPIYTGSMVYDIPTSDVITSDKKSMIADNYVIWHVTDPVLIYQKLGGNQSRAEERIEAAVYNATKNTISSMTQDDIIAARGTMLTDMITEASNSEIGQYGIRIDKAEIKALDLPDQNKEAVYERMISERSNIAASYTAQGDSDAQKIINDTDKEVSILKASANADAARTKAEGEAEYMRILSDAYNDVDKAEFYNFLLGLDALESLASKGSTVILDKDSDIAKLLYGIQ